MNFQEALLEPMILVFQLVKVSIHLVPPTAAIIAKIATIFFPIFPRTIPVASANGAVEFASSIGEIIPISATEENRYIQNCNY